MSKSPPHSAYAVQHEHVVGDRVAYARIEPQQFGQGTSDIWKQLLMGCLLYIWPKGIIVTKKSVWRLWRLRTVPCARGRWWWGWRRRIQAMVRRSFAPTCAPNAAIHEHTA